MYLFLGLDNRSCNPIKNYFCGVKSIQNVGDRIENFHDFYHCFDMSLSGTFLQIGFKLESRTQVFFFEAIVIGMYVCKAR